MKIELFGSSTSLLAGGSSQNVVEFCLTHIRQRDERSSTESSAVRRSMKDMKWLNDTFISHKALGGIL